MTVFEIGKLSNETPKQNVVSVYIPSREIGPLETETKPKCPRVFPKHFRKKNSNSVSKELSQSGPRGQH